MEFWSASQHFVWVLLSWLSFDRLPSMFQMRTEYLSLMLLMTSVDVSDAHWIPLPDASHDFHPCFRCALNTSPLCFSWLPSMFQMRIEYLSLMLLMTSIHVSDAHWIPLPYASHDFRPCFRCALNTSPWCFSWLPSMFQMRTEYLSLMLLMTSVHVSDAHWIPLPDASHDFRPCFRCALNTSPWCFSWLPSMFQMCTEYLSLMLLMTSVHVSDAHWIPLPDASHDFHPCFRCALNTSPWCFSWLPSMFHMRTEYLSLMLLMTSVHVSDAHWIPLPDASHDFRPCFRCALNTSPWCFSWLPSMFQMRTEYLSLMLLMTSVHVSDAHWIPLPDACHDFRPCFRCALNTSPWCFSWFPSMFQMRTEYLSLMLLMTSVDVSDAHWIPLPDASHDFHPCFRCALNTSPWCFSSLPSMFHMRTEYLSLMLLMTSVHVSDVHWIPLPDASHDFHPCFRCALNTSPWCFSWLPSMFQMRTEYLSLMLLMISIHVSDAHWIPLPDASHDFHPCFRCALNTSPWCFSWLPSMFQMRTEYLSLMLLMTSIHVSDAHWIPLPDASHDFRPCFRCALNTSPWCFSWLPSMFQMRTEYLSLMLLMTSVHVSDAHWIPLPDASHDFHPCFICALNTSPWCFSWLPSMFQMRTEYLSLMLLMTSVHVSDVHWIPLPDASHDFHPCFRCTLNTSPWCFSWLPSMFQMRTEYLSLMLLMISIHVSDAHWIPLPDASHDFHPCFRCALNTSPWCFSWLPSMFQMRTEYLSLMLLMTSIHVSDAHWIPLPDASHDFHPCFRCALNTSPWCFSWLPSMFHMRTEYPSLMLLMTSVDVSYAHWIPLPYASHDFHPCFRCALNTSPWCFSWLPSMFQMRTEYLSLMLLMTSVHVSDVHWIPLPDASHDFHPCFRCALNTSPWCFSWLPSMFQMRTEYLSLMLLMISIHVSDAHWIPLPDASHDFHPCFRCALNTSPWCFSWLPSMFQMRTEYLSLMLLMTSIHVSDAHWIPLPDASHDFHPCFRCALNTSPRCFSWLPSMFQMRTEYLSLMLLMTSIHVSDAHWIPLPDASHDFRPCFRCALNTSPWCFSWLPSMFQMRTEYLSLMLLMTSVHVSDAHWIPLPDASHDFHSCFRCALNTSPWCFSWLPSMFQMRTEYLSLMLLMTSVHVSDAHWIPLPDASHDFHPCFICALNTSPWCFSWLPSMFQMRTEYLSLMLLMTSVHVSDAHWIPLPDASHDFHPCFRCALNTSPWCFSWLPSMFQMRTEYLSLMLLMTSVHVSDAHWIPLPDASHDFHPCFRCALNTSPWCFSWLPSMFQMRTEYLSLMLLMTSVHVSDAHWIPLPDASHDFHPCFICALNTSPWCFSWLPSMFQMCTEYLSLMLLMTSVHVSDAHWIPLPDASHDFHPCFRCALNTSPWCFSWLPSMFQMRTEYLSLMLLMSSIHVSDAHWIPLPDASHDFRPCFRCALNTSPWCFSWLPSMFQMRTEYLSLMLLMTSIHVSDAHWIPLPDASHDFHPCFRCALNTSPWCFSWLPSMFQMRTEYLSLMLLMTSVHVSDAHWIPLPDASHDFHPCFRCALNTSPCCFSWLPSMF